ncbi:hypothetical protein [Actinomadura kijaniata]|uniref:hypothetical protein n=1 Tax=Actinomadura kijaniata TaxID=46161 RepID=UPI000831FBBB|nr:hypothetical protein [Actinomadura kijaniata]
MTFGAALRRAVSAVPCRGAVRRLLVVVGLAAAGWLLGGAAQAEAETPDARRVVADTPVVGDAVRVAERRVLPERPVREIVRAVKDREVEPPVKVERPPADPPVRQVVPDAGAVPAAKADKGEPVAKRSVKRNASKRVHRTAGDAHVFAGTFEKNASHSGAADQAAPVAPIPALAQAGGVSPAAGLILIGGIGAPLARRAWVPGRPQGVLLRAPGAVPPAVRTAADEPSFAPD